MQKDGRSNVKRPLAAVPAFAGPMHPGKDARILKYADARLVSEASRAPPTDLGQNCAIDLCYFRNGRDRFANEPRHSSSTIE
ncbi:MAG: hypothetical protein EOO61_07100 [Hymenobacter sp.]|nr:MAG: hypothetical protein EOO61_07100 [Hymenobacter sp.]